LEIFLLNNLSKGYAFLSSCPQLLIITPILTADIKIRVYFAHKGCPWERGTNENFNGLVRQFFPKGTDFNKVSNYHINIVQNMLNGRPRRVLNWQTPYEAFIKIVALKA
jgi:IS30 family transposase